MPTGSVKFFNTSKGFGFITLDDGGKDVFVPPASAVALGEPLKAGQRVSFETVPDKKGPKATNLVILSNPAPLKVALPAPRPVPTEKPKDRLIYYHDPSSDSSAEVLETLRASGYEPNVVDYIATPPARDELKRLSLLLRDGKQGLVRKFDRLFHELQLDDRFISENEFWTAVFEHPALINGPIVATASNAAICHSEESATRFLSTLSPNAGQGAAKRRDLPKVFASLVSSNGVIPPMEQGDKKAPAGAEPPSKIRDLVKDGEKKAAKAKPKAKSKVQPKTKVKAKAVTKPARATSPKADRKAKAKTIAPKKKVAKKAAAMPSKKPKPASKK